MTNYRIDFINNGHQLQHSIDHNSAIDPKLSGQKIAGNDYFSHEPVRLEFSCYPDNWLNEYLLSGNYESVRYIWNFMIRFYENNSLVFTGIVDTSSCSYDEETEEIRIIAYDKLKLFEKFSDAKMLFALLYGYSPDYCVRYFAQKINLLTDLPMTLNWANYQPLTINKTHIVIQKIKWKEILKDFQSWLYFHIAEAGFCEIDQITRFMIKIVAYRYKLINGIPAISVVKIYALQYKFYNNICFFDNKPLEQEFDFTSWEAVTSLLNNYNYTLYQDFTDSKGNYFVFETPDFNYNTAPEEKEIYFTGNIIPYQIYPKGFYENNGEQTQYMTVLKTMLLLHNLTLTCDSTGIIHLKNKQETTGQIHLVDEADIIKMTIKRLNRALPEINTLDNLIGDTAILKENMNIYYENLAGQKFEVELTIDDTSKYELKLFDQIYLKNKHYIISNLSKNNNLEAWELNAWEI
jgi:hypothetical protein